MKYKFTKIPIQSLASGDSLSILVHQFKGGPGPKFYIQANIHGPEVAGTALVSNLVKILKKQKALQGEIILVSSANPIGLNSKIGGFSIGYINLNGDSSNNWNRIFFDLTKQFDIESVAKDSENSNISNIKEIYQKKLIKALEGIETEKSLYGLSIEQKLALTLQKLSVDADFVIDLHSAGINQTHLYAFPGLIAIAKIFGIQHVLELPLNFTGSFDESFYLPWTALAQAYTNLKGKELEHNKESYTLELENDNQIDSVKTAHYTEMILNYLKSKKMLKGSVKLCQDPLWVCKSDDYIKYFAPVGGLVEPMVVVGQKVKKGTPLLKIGSINQDLTEKIIYAQENCTINSFPVSKVVSEGEPVIGILKNLKEIK